jgi:pilus assembly protein CpaF
VAAHEDQVELQEIFTFERTGVTEQGKVQGRFKGTGVRPRIMERLRVSGISLPDSVFTETLAVNT